VLASAAVLTGLGTPGSAATTACYRGFTVVPSPSPNGSGVLSGVAVVPRSSQAWAVGQYASKQNPTYSLGLLLHWNGKAWKQVPSPNPSISNTVLDGVAAVSATDAWAVGSSRRLGRPPKVLILHWNGRSWKQWPVPTSASGGGLIAVTAVSRNDAWALGSASQTLHWNGTRWRQLPSADAGLDSALVAIAAVSATDVWEVGYNDADYSVTVIEHWNGKAWKQVPSPNPDPDGYQYAQDYLYGVAAVSATDVWAVGPSTNDYYNVNVPIVERWGGKQWKVVTSPAPAYWPLNAVTAISGRQAWAVGSSIQHWNGRTWNSEGRVVVAGMLYAVAASAPGNAWAVGGRGHRKATLIMHSC
jgi:hypothetical protein